MQDRINLKQQIIDGAQGIFSKFGLKKSTMNKIAAQINMAKSSVYYYFKSKDEIYEAVIEKEASVFRSEIYKVMASYKTPQDKIKHYVLTRMTLFHKLANFYTAFQKEYTENYSFINKIRKKYDEEEQQIISEVLQQGITDGIIDVKDVSLTSLAILNAMKGFEYQWSVERELSQIEKDIDALLEILFYGIVKR